MTTRVESAGGSRTLIGYCTPWTVRSGQRVDFRVSCEREGAYQADLVRLICADGLSSPASFKEVPVDAPFAGTYSGRFRATYPGSYVEIATRPVLDRLRNFSVQAMVYPTLLPGGVRTRAGGEANSWEQPVFDDQFLISRWDGRTQQGWALLIDRAGRPAFLVGKGGQTQRAVLDHALVQDRWFLLLGSLDADQGTLHIAARAMARAPGDEAAWPQRAYEARYPNVQDVPQAGPLWFAAGTDGAGHGARLKPTCCFNGRLDRVRLTSGVMGLEQALELARTTRPESLRARLMGFWDFSRDIDRIEITDLSSHALHGVTVNVPTRAVAGVDWDGSVVDWRAGPEHYSAIHFHDDDLYDAEWKTDFSFNLPEGLSSGIYAARLRQGDSQEYIPFFVAPPRGQARAAVAILLPTATYTAYTNITGLTTFKRKRQVKDDSGEAKVIEEDLHPCLLQDASHADFLLKHHRCLGKGIYSNHSDGTLASCASQLHPNMAIQPRGVNWTLVADTYITDWLEQKQIPYDVITDDLLHEEGAPLLERYAVVLTGNHPEYYTRRMLDAVDRYQREGGRWMYLGGNGFYWVTSFHPQLPGLIEVRKDVYAGHFPPYERRHAFDGEEGGKWGENGRSPALLVGSTYVFEHGYAMEGGTSYQRLPHSYQPRAAFVFEGVSEEVFGGYGVFGGGAAGQEVDRIDPEHGAPAHTLHLARADAFRRYGSLLAEEYALNTPGPVADLLFFETPKGGAVFSVGSMSWGGALSHNGYENDIARITENVLRRFMDPRPFLDEKAVENAARVA